MTPAATRSPLTPGTTVLLLTLLLGVQPVATDLYLPARPTLQRELGAIGPSPEKAGNAASLSGFCMMLAAFGVSQWLGRHLDGSVYPMTLGVGLAGLGITAVAWTLIQQHGDPPRAAAARSARADAPG